MLSLGRNTAVILRRIVVMQSCKPAAPNWRLGSIFACDRALLPSSSPCRSISFCRMPVQLQHQVNTRPRDECARSRGIRPLVGVANSMMTPEMYSEAATRKPAVYCSAGTAREVALFMLVKILQEYPGRANTALEQTWKRHMEPVARKYADRGCMDALVKHEQLEMLRNPFACLEAVNDKESQLNFQATVAQLLALDKAYAEHWDDLMEEIWDRDEAIDELYIRYVEPAAAPWDERESRSTEAGDVVVERIAVWVEKEWFDNPPGA